MLYYIWPFRVEKNKMAGLEKIWDQTHDPLCDDSSGLFEGTEAASS